nr:glycosyltransferase [Algibacter lectus]
MYNADAYDKEKFEIPKTSKVIIQVSNFSPQKDQITLIKAVALLPEHVYLFLVGDGPLKKASETLALDLGISKRVLFLGPRTDVPNLIKTADIAVLSSNHEGFGLAILEGMAAEKPCVASNVDGLSEIIKDAGVLFEKGNELELRDILLNIIKDESFQKTIAQKCYRRSKKFDIQFMVDNYLSIYNNNNN